MSRSSCSRCCLPVFSLLATFAWNVTLSAVARLFYYGAICLAVPVLRARQPGAALVRLPAAWALPALGVLLCATLLTRVDFSKSLVLLATRRHCTGELARGAPLADARRLRA